VPLGRAFLPSTGVVDAQVVVQARYVVPSGSTLTSRAPPFSLPLHAPPAWAPLSQPAVFITFPVRPLFAGSVFAIGVYAYSPQRCVNEFLLPFFFDPTVLRLDGGGENSALYSPGLLIQDKLAEGIFSLSVQSARSPSTCNVRRVSICPGPAWRRLTVTHADAKRIKSDALDKLFLTICSIM
jgi:hypothetical protein